MSSRTSALDRKTYVLPWIYPLADYAAPAILRPKSPSYNETPPSLPPFPRNFTSHVRKRKIPSLHIIINKKKNKNPKTILVDFSRAFSGFQSLSPSNLNRDLQKISSSSSSSLSGSRSLSDFQIFGNVSLDHFLLLDLRKIPWKMAKSRARRRNSRRGEGGNTSLSALTIASFFRCPPSRIRSIRPDLRPSNCQVTRTLWSELISFSLCWILLFCVVLIWLCWIFLGFCSFWFVWR